jgi:hypothetical protein
MFSLRNMAAGAAFAIAGAFAAAGDANADCTIEKNGVPFVFHYTCADNPLKLCQGKFNKAVQMSPSAHIVGTMTGDCGRWREEHMPKTTTRVIEKHVPAKSALPESRGTVGNHRQNPVVTKKETKPFPARPKVCGVLVSGPEGLLECSMK